MEFTGWGARNDTPSEDQWKWLWHGARAVETAYAFLNVEGPKVLDVGCGKSQLAYCLYKLGYDAYGIDNDQDMYDFHDFPNFWQMDATKTKFKDETFDTVVSISVIEHIPEDKKVIKEMTRILKSGGVLILTTAYGEGYLSSMTRLYTKSEIKKLLDGFNIEEMRFFRFTDTEHDEYDGKEYFENAIMIIKARKCANTKPK